MAKKDAVSAGVKLIGAIATIILSARSAGKNGEKAAQAFIDLKKTLRS